jgi:hypothetical protein
MSASVPVTREIAVEVTKDGDFIGYLHPVSMSREMARKWAFFTHLLHRNKIRATTQFIL